MAAREDVRLHVDAAFGGDEVPVALTRALLGPLSLPIAPHTFWWLFLMYATLVHDAHCLLMLDRSAHLAAWRWPGGGQAPKSGASTSAKDSHVIQTFNAWRPLQSSQDKSMRPGDVNKVRGRSRMDPIAGPTVCSLTSYLFGNTQIATYPRAGSAILRTYNWMRYSTTASHTIRLSVSS